MINRLIRNLKLRFAIGKYKKSLASYEIEVNKAFEQWATENPFPHFNVSSIEDIQLYNKKHDSWYSSRPSTLKTMSSMLCGMRVRLSEMKQKLND